MELGIANGNLMGRPGWIEGVFSTFGKNDVVMKDKTGQKLVFVTRGSNR